MARRIPTRALLLPLTLAALPITAFAASEPAQKGADYYTKKVCRTERAPGSRIGGVRRCFTQAEFDRQKAEDRRVVERVQTMKATTGH